MHTRPQVDILTLVLTSLLCSIGIAALRRHKHLRYPLLLLSATSGVSLSFLSLYCSLPYQIHSSISNQHEEWTPPSIDQLTRAETVIFLDNSPWHKPLHIPNMASSNLCRLLIHDMNHKIWQSSNLAVNLSMTWTITRTVINMNRIRSMVNLMLEACVRYPLYIVI